MNKTFHIVVEIIFWLAIFCSPLLISLANASIIYINSPKLEWFSIIISSVGLVSGVLFAERIRRKYGCTKYMSRLISTPDIWPTDTYDRKSKNENKSKQTS
jgi:hypothetical protein